MSVMVTLNVNSKLNVLAFDADDYELETLESGETVVNVLEAVDGPGLPMPQTIATVRDWSAVTIDPTPTGEIVDMVSRALKGDTAAPCEKCADREARLADSLRRQHHIAAKAFEDIQNRGNVRG